MTIRHLRIFLAVADSGTMSQAAKKLYITQPSVSQAVRSWKNTIGFFCLNGYPRNFTSLWQGKPFTLMRNRWYFSLTS